MSFDLSNFGKTGDSERLSPTFADGIDDKVTESQAFDASANFLNDFDEKSDDEDEKSEDEKSDDEKQDDSGDNDEELEQVTEMAVDKNDEHVTEMDVDDEHEEGETKLCKIVCVIMFFLFSVLFFLFFKVFADDETGLLLATSPKQGEDGMVIVDAFPWIQHEVDFPYKTLTLPLSPSEQRNAIGADFLRETLEKNPRFCMTSKGLARIDVFNHNIELKFNHVYGKTVRQKTVSQNAERVENVLMGYDFFMERAKENRVKTLDEAMCLIPLDATTKEIIAAADMCLRGKGLFYCEFKNGTVASDEKFAFWGEINQYLLRPVWKAVKRCLLEQEGDELAPVQLGDHKYIFSETPDRVLAEFKEGDSECEYKSYSELF